MWVLVLFDLPTNTKKERSQATRFRKVLLKDGYNMFQFSIYIRFCTSRQQAQKHISRVKLNIPKKGEICIIQITDKQFAMIELFRNKEKTPSPPVSQQLELF